MHAAWKQAAALGAVLLLTLTGTACSFLPGKTKDTPQPAQPSISPIVAASEDYYASVAPFQPNQTRGMLANYGYRIDFSHLELGLTEIARETFAPDKYLFQEGQQLKREQVNAWISRKKQNPEALNPEKGPRTLVHILEHDYLEKDSRKLAGIVLGISLSPLYQDTSGAEKSYSSEELRTKGQQLAAQILPKVRANNPNIPMVVALFQVPEKNSSLVPGHFIMSGTVGATDSSVSKWVPINEEYYLFPSDAAEKAQPQVSLQYDKLRKSIQSYIGEYIGLTGLGRFSGGELNELTITATAEYDSRTVVLQFTQYAGGLIDQLFDKNVHVNLYVQSMNQPLAIYVRPAEGKPYMHIYRK
ncbi:sex pheromone biosynthesis protein CamS [Brevibacillus fluminis]|uniref:Sex pheromone biosynthesis protein CamS n=1 Tax=Brevibacillus fluminis TaxID=511487 RepID=A0A3M8D0V1_9BACL|nr:CamS family sex pheromone protein [Brevibacillus fluminis]RNB81047.1 sex pheromone biosynthesis protein CamS [Brevibacillus fluminis]